MVGRAFAQVVCCVAASAAFAGGDASGVAQARLGVIDICLASEASVHKLERKLRSIEPLVGGVNVGSEDRVARGTYFVGTEADGFLLSYSSRRDDASLIDTCQVQVETTGREELSDWLRAQVSIQDERPIVSPVDQKMTVGFIGKTKSADRLFEISAIYTNAPRGGKDLVSILIKS